MKLIIPYQDEEEELFDCLTKRNQTLMKGLTKKRITAQEIIDQVQ